MKGLRLTEEEFARLRAAHAPKSAAIAPKGTVAQAVHRSLGRMGGGKMNKSEAAYAAHLDALKSVGQILWYRFEGMKFRLADNTFYTPDFAVIVASGALELHEFKGFMEEDANVKIKTAATQYPFVFRLIRKGKGGTWDIREV